jgi:tripartite-type tricarboxylate transporter receptor subunit TctC
MGQRAAAARKNTCRRKRLPPLRCRGYARSQSEVTEAAVDNEDGAVVLVEPFGAGGGVDVIARPLAAQLAEILKAPVTVDNCPGAGATAAPALVASAPPDGRTLLINTSAHAYSGMFAGQLPYDPIVDFVAIAPVTSQPYVLVAGPRSELRTLVGLVDAARARPGELAFTSAGLGTGTHLSVEQLNCDLGVEAIHLPARPGDAIDATIARVAAGEADYAMSPIPIASPRLVGGTLLALGVSGIRRSPLLPDVPTLAEAGAAGFDFPIWYGIWAPAATPRPIVSALAAGLSAALKTPRLRTWLAEHGAEPMSMTPSEFASFVEREVERARVIAQPSGRSPS